MMFLILEWTVRSSVLGLLVWMALKATYVRDPRVERGTWRIVLASSLLMPLLIKLSAASPVGTPILSADSVELLTLAMPVSAPIWDQVLLALVALISVALLARHSIGIAKWWFVRRRAQRLSMHGELDVRMSAEVSSPATVFSTVLVPLDFGDWSEEAQRLAIAHERSHVANQDFYFQWLAQLHRNLFWFNPFAWWLASHLSLLSEHVSDDAATHDRTDRTTYARVLLSLAQRATTNQLMVPMIRTPSLARRIERILREGDPVRAGAAKTLLIACILVPLIAAATVQIPNPPGDVIDRASLGIIPGASVVLPKSNPTKPLSAPAYPSASRRVGEQGTVVLRLLVLEDGSVADAVIARTSGYPDLDYSALYEAYEWRLDPGTIDSTPSRMWGRFAVTFKLSND